MRYFATILITVGYCIQRLLPSSSSRQRTRSGVPRRSVENLNDTIFNNMRQFLIRDLDGRLSRNSLCFLRGIKPRFLNGRRRNAGRPGERDRYGCGSSRSMHLTVNDGLDFPFGFIEVNQSVF